MATVTDNLGLTIPDKGDTDWEVQADNNYQLIDAALSSTVSGSHLIVDSTDYTGTLTLEGKDNVSLHTSGDTITISGSVSEVTQAELDTTNANVAALTTSGIVQDGHIQSLTTSGVAQDAELLTVSGHLQTEIDAVEGSDVDSVNTFTGAITIAGAGGNTIVNDDPTVTVSGFRDEFVNASGTLQEDINERVTITGGYLTGPLALSAGSAAAPSLTFWGDEDTGIFGWVGSNALSITAGGDTLVTYLPFAGISGSVHYGNIIAQGDIFAQGTTISGSGVKAEDLMEVGGLPVATEAYVTTVSGHLQTDIDTRVLRAGDTMTGDLTVEATVSGIDFYTADLTSTGTITAPTGTFSESLTISGTTVVTGTVVRPYEWDQNGFVDRDQSTIAFTSPGDVPTVTITPTGDHFDYFIAGVRYVVASADDTTFADEEGLWATYYDGTVLTNIKNPSHGQVEAAIEDGAIVSYVYWDATNKAGKLMEERHGMSMSPATHRYLHDTIGMVYEDGLALEDMDVDGNWADTSAAQFGTAAGEVYDEDLEHSLEAVAAATGLEIWYLDTADWRWTTNAGFSILTAGTGRMAWNDGGTQVEVGNNQFALCHVFATNAADLKPIAIQGQATYLTANLARIGANTEINSLLLGTLPSAEMKPIATVIFQTGNTAGNAVKSKVRSTDEGDDYVDWRTNPIQPGVGAQDHGQLGGLSDDDHSQYPLEDGTRGFSATVSGSTPVLDHDLATKAYIDTISGTLVTKTGDTMTGELIAPIGTFTETLTISGATVVTGTITTKSITVENPEVDESLPFFFTDRTLTLSRMQAVISGTAPSPTVTWTIRHDPDRTATGTEVVTAGTVTTATTTGESVTAFDSDTVPAESHVWLETTAAEENVVWLNVTLMAWEG